MTADPIAGERQTPLGEIFLKFQMKLVERVHQTGYGTACIRGSRFYLFGATLRRESQDSMEPPGQSGGFCP
jgi:hypothetical protein